MHILVHDMTSGDMTMECLAEPDEYPALKSTACNQETKKLTTKTNDIKSMMNSTNCEHVTEGASCQH